MSARPGSSAGRPGTSSQQKIGAGPIPMGTASRLTTAAPGTAARPGSRGGVAGGGIALSSQLQVVDRPVTQQGLGGPKTAANRGPQRVVQDKTYFLGLLRTKVNELSSEIGRLRVESESIANDQSSFVSYEKRAEVLAQEMKELQAELGDYNMLVDRMNTESSINDMQMDYNDSKASNDREALGLDSLFEKKQEKESVVKQLELELKQERSLAETMIADMPEDMRRKYSQMKDLNEHLLKQLETGRQELDRLTLKQKELEEELGMSPFKQEAVRLYEQLRELETKRDQLMLEVQSKLSPQEERERLLKQVKDDNAEIAVMERQMKEMQERMGVLQEELRQLDIDLEVNQGERSQQIKELKKREETMDEFLSSFENNRTQEIERIKQLEASIVHALENISRNLSRSNQLPTAQELNSMKDDLAFKEREMQKSEATASVLASESTKLQQDLQKVEQLETKVTEELKVLKEKITTMTAELETYSNLEQLKVEAEAKKKKLSEDKIILHRRREMMKTMMRDLAMKYESLKTQLGENETHTQLTNLERKWQHLEQNNFVVKEFIAAKTRETDFHETSKKVSTIISEYNQYLVDVMSGKAPRRV